MNAIIHAKLYDFHTYKEDMYLLFEDTIIDIGPMSEFVDEGYTIIDASNKIVMPSLVVGHTHLYSKLARGLSVPLNPSNFKEILEQLWWKVDRNLDNKMTYYSGIVGASDYLLNGVTTIIDHHASGEIIGSLDALQRGVKEVGLRGIYCFETSDRFEIDHCLKENIKVCNTSDSYQGGLFGLHASFSLSDETLKRVKEVVGTSPIHIHVAESAYDVIYTKETFGTTIIERLDSFGLLQPDSILVHGIHLIDSDLDIIQKRKCVIALNVTSNMNNGVGIASYKRMKAKGIPVIIGNDGLSSSITTEYLNIYYVSHLKEESITGFSLDDLKDIIQNTYEYVNRHLDVSIGQLEPGYQADILLHDFLIPTPLDSSNILGHLFFGYFNSFRPSDVFVNGNQLVTNYSLTKEPYSKYQESKQAAAELWQRIDKEVTK